MYFQELNGDVPTEEEANKLKEQMWPKNTANIKSKFENYEQNTDEPKDTPQPIDLQAEISGRLSYSFSATSSEIQGFTSILVLLKVLSTNGVQGLHAVLWSIQTGAREPVMLKYIYCFPKQKAQLQFTKSKA